MPQPLITQRAGREFAHTTAEQPPRRQVIDAVSEIQRKAADARQRAAVLQRRAGQRHRALREQLTLIFQHVAVERQTIQPRDGTAIAERVAVQRQRARLP